MSDSIKTRILPLHEAPSADLETSSQREPALILIVDDEPLIADTLTAIVARMGYRTLRAYSGKRALQLALLAHPDLLITDVFMPDLDGPSLAVCIVTRLPRCRVLLVSGHATREQLAAAREAGHDFTLLQKPVPPAEMLHHIQVALQ